MVFRYGAGESRFTERKQHVDEQQWSPVVYFDAPRCILCYRCVRVCNEGMGVGALGVSNRGVISEIVPNRHDYLECDECGACIDICPVGALTSGSYRYQTRPWEMEHVGTICTHCGDGCRTTLGVRDDKIMRGNNRDSSGINGEFLCVKGRYAFDFVEHPERLQSPMLRNAQGEFEPISWSKAFATIAENFTAVNARGGKFGVIGSNHTTNEENYFLQKFARQGLGTKNIDHHRTGDLATFFDALIGKECRARYGGRSVHGQGCAGRGRRSCAAASLPLLSGAGEFPASQRAHLCGHNGSGSRRQPSVRERSRCCGRGTRRRRVLARQAESGRRPGHRLWRFGPGRRCTQAGRVRRFAGDSGEIRLPGGLLEFARRVRHGADSSRRGNECGTDASCD